MGELTRKSIIFLAIIGFGTCLSIIATQKILKAMITIGIGSLILGGTLLVIEIFITIKRKWRDRKSYKKMIDAGWEKSDQHKKSRRGKINE